MKDAGRYDSFLNDDESSVLHLPRGPGRLALCGSEHPAPLILLSSTGPLRGRMIRETFLTVQMHLAAEAPNPHPREEINPS